TPPAAVIQDQPALASHRERVKKYRTLGGPLVELTRAEPHTERAPGFADRNIVAQDSGPVLAFERDQMAAGIEHRDGERRAFDLAAVLERYVDDSRGLSKR